MIEIPTISELKDYDLAQSYRTRGDIYKRTLTYWIYDTPRWNVEVSKSDKETWVVTIMNGARIVYAGRSRTEMIAVARKWLKRGNGND